MMMMEFSRRNGWIPVAAAQQAEVARDNERERGRLAAAAADKAAEKKVSDEEWKQYLVEDIGNHKSVRGNPKQVGMQTGNRFPESRGRRGGGGQAHDAGYVSLAGLDLTDSSTSLGELLRRAEMRGKPQTHELYMLNKALSHLSDLELVIAGALKEWKVQREAQNRAVPRPSAPAAEMGELSVPVPLDQLLCWFNTLRGAVGNLSERHQVVETIARSQASNATPLEVETAAEYLMNEHMDRKAEGLQNVSRTAAGDREVDARTKATMEALNKERAKRLNPSVKDAIPKAGGGRGGK